MPRSYKHISRYEKEILEMKSKGMTLKKLEKNMDLAVNKYTTSLQGIIKSKEE